MSPEEWLGSQRNGSTLKEPEEWLHSQGARGMAVLALEEPEECLHSRGANTFRETTP